ncbi:hypothetical protein JCM4914_39530 [Streptomyces platensis subsp. malvinus]
MSGVGGFKVDVGELGLLVQKLALCSESMLRASDNLRSASTGDLGNVEIDESASDFKDSWGYGVSQIAKMTTALHGGLQATARTYSETDSAIEQALSKGVSSGSSPGGGSAATPFG